MLAAATPAPFGGNFVHAEPGEPPGMRDERERRAGGDRADLAVADAGRRRACRTASSAGRRRRPSSPSRPRRSSGSGRSPGRTCRPSRAAGLMPAPWRGVVPASTIARVRRSSTTTKMPLRSKVFATGLPSIQTAAAGSSDSVTSGTPIGGSSGRTTTVSVSRELPSRRCRRSAAARRCRGGRASAAARRCRRRRASLFAPRGALAIRQRSLAAAAAHHDRRAPTSTPRPATVPASRPASASGRVTRHRPRRDEHAAVASASPAAAAGCRPGRRPSWAVSSPTRARGRLRGGRRCWPRGR